MNIKVLFFGVLTELTGTSLKVYSGVRSLEELILRITDDYPEMIHYEYAKAVNNEIVTGDTLLKDGDEIALMPPFAGG
jgi:molybdopterin synthase sulfur carrier subunit